MNYVINPMWFYLLGVVGKIENVFTAISIVAVLFSVMFFFVRVVCSMELNSDTREKLEFWSKFFALLSVFTWLIFAIIPKEKTIIQMAISKQITYANFDKAEGKIKSTFYYIVDKTKEFDEGEE